MSWITSFYPTMGAGNDDDELAEWKREKLIRLRNYSNLFNLQTLILSESRLDYFLLFPIPLQSVS